MASGDDAAAIDGLYSSSLFVVVVVVVVVVRRRRSSFVVVVVLHGGGNVLPSPYCKRTVRCVLHVMKSFAFAPLRGVREREQAGWST